MAVAGADPKSGEPAAAEVPEKPLTWLTRTLNDI